MTDTPAFLAARAAYFRIKNDPRTASPAQDPDPYIRAIMQALGVADKSSDGPAPEPPQEYVPTPADQRAGKPLAKRPRRA